MELELELASELASEPERGLVQEQVSVAERVRASVSEQASALVQVSERARAVGSAQESADTVRARDTAGTVRVRDKGLARGKADMGRKSFPGQAPDQGRARFQGTEPVRGKARISAFPHRDNPFP